MEQNERTEKKTFIEIIEELNDKNGKLEKENAALKEKLEAKKLSEQKLNLQTFHTDPTFYRQIEDHEKCMTMFYLKLRLKVVLGIFGFAALIMLIGLALGSMVK